jgi:hypothetical protein
VLTSMLHEIVRGPLPSIGPGLCRMLDTNFAERSTGEIRKKYLLVEQHRRFALCFLHLRSKILVI